MGRRWPRPPTRLRSRKIGSVCHPAPSPGQRRLELSSRRATDERMVVLLLCGPGRQGRRWSSGCWRPRGLLKRGSADRLARGEGARRSQIRRGGAGEASENALTAPPAAGPLTLSGHHGHRLVAELRHPLPLAARRRWRSSGSRPWPKSAASIWKRLAIAVGARRLRGRDLVDSSLRADVLQRARRRPVEGAPHPGRLESRLGPGPRVARAPAARTARVA